MMQHEQNQTWRKLGALFWSFCKMSPVSFGGGYAMLPVIEHEVMTRRKWISETEMAEVISISGAAPGGIAVNAAASVGYKVMGWRGLVAAVAGMMLPTFLIVLVLGIFFAVMRDQPKVLAALQGIQMAVLALITYAGLKMARSAIFDKTTMILFVLGLAGLIAIGMHPILLIPAGIAAGIVLVKSKERFGFAIALTKHQADMKQTAPVMQPSFAGYYFGDGI